MAINGFQNVRIKEEIYLKLKALAKKEGRKIGFVFERAMKNYLKLKKVD